MCLHGLTRTQVEGMATRSISRIFFQDKIQKLLKDITHFEESRIFANRLVECLETPRLMFMTDKQLEVAKKQAYEEAEARLQMPPVLEADTSQPKVLSKDEELVGYTNLKVMFVDLSPGQSERSRLMSVREPDGTLRFPSHEERSRLNHIFYPHESKPVDTPKLFEPSNLLKLLNKEEYNYVLDRACLQFEPDDPRYVEITSEVYTHIDRKKHYDKLKSTRHFGPMSLYLAYNDCVQGLVVHLVTHKLSKDAAKLVKVYNTCHNIDYDDNDSDESILSRYMEQHSLSNLV